MRYTVVWTKSAENELAALWLAHPFPQRIADAADAIDRNLAIDPARFGPESPAGHRQLIVSPLGVDFRISELDRRVTVMTVWLEAEHSP